MNYILFIRYDLTTGFSCQISYRGGLLGMFPCFMGQGANNIFMDNDLKRKVKKE